MANYELIDHEFDVVVVGAGAAGIAGPAYLIADRTAIQVVDGEVEVVSEGHWKLLGA